MKMKYDNSNGQNFLDRKFKPMFKKIWEILKIASKIEIWSYFFEEDA